MYGFNPWAGDWKATGDSRASAQGNGDHRSGSGGTGIYIRYAGLPLQHNIVSEYFLIRKGKIHAIWSAMYFLPLGAPDLTGWENRHGIWR